MIEPFRRSLLLLVLAALAACSGEEEEVSQDNSGQARAVTVARVEIREMAKTITASGILVPRDEITVDSEISGFRVQSVVVDEGQLVRKGQPLARLDETLLLSQLARARAQLAQAKAQAAEAHGEAERVKGLDGTGVLSDEQIASRRFKAESGAAAVGVAQAVLRDLEVQRGRMVIRSPAAGIVMERNARVGEIASPGGEPMFRIIRGSLVELDAEVPEGMLAEIPPGSSVQVSAPGGVIVEGQVRFVSPRVDPATKLGRVRVSLPRDAQLRAGGFAKAEFKLRSRKLPAIPEKAVQYESGGPVVAVIDKADRASLVRIKPGVRANGWVELKEGPAPGTRVALGGGAFLFKGDKVRPVRPASENQTAKSRPKSQD